MQAVGKHFELVDREHYLGETYSVDHVHAVETQTYRGQPALPPGLNVVFGPGRA